MTARLLASVELGGTKTIVAVGVDPVRPIQVQRFATSDPATTLAQVITCLDAARRGHGPLMAIGVGAFGPIRLDADAPDWGRLLTTTKPGWNGAAVATTLRDALSVPVAIDTDVNAAALAESVSGAGQGSRDLAYVTVGTGIGVGLVLDGRPRHGMLHPEVGHIRVQRHMGDTYPGLCPYHGDCLEGLASGPAISARLGQPLDTLDPAHPFRAILADYLAQLCLTLTLVSCVDRIVIGGGAVRNLDLLPTIARQLRALIGGYAGGLDGGPTLRAPVFEDSGLTGGFILASAAAGQVAG